MSFLSANGAWQPGANRAKHDYHSVGHPVPYPGCKCGYWIRTSIRGAAALWSPGHIIGAAQGWGKVIPHEDGWRVEYAAVLALHMPAALRDLLPGDEYRAQMEAVRQICERYEVPLLTGAQLAELQ